MRERGRLALFVLILVFLSIFIFNPKFTGFVSILFTQDNISVSDDSVAITWDTDVDSNSTIFYGTSEVLGHSESRGDFTTEHIVLITNLSENSTYFFNITSCDIEGNCTTAGVFNFTTSFLSETALEQPQTNTSDAVSFDFLNDTPAFQNLTLPPEEIPPQLIPNDISPILSPEPNATTEIANVSVEEPKIVIEANEKAGDAVVDQIAVKEEVAVIVVLKEASPEDVLSELNYTLANDSASGSDLKLKYEYDTTNSFAGNVTAEGLQKLMNSPDVEKIILDKQYHIMLMDSVPLINANDLWNTTVNGLNITGEGRTICVADTGIDYTHQDLGGCTNASFLAGTCNKVLGGYDFVNNDVDPIDDHGHGTHVASTAAGNGVLKGVARNATIVSVKVCGTGGSCFDSDMLAGFEWCIQNRDTYNISVITMSVGGGAYDNQTLCDAADPAFTEVINNATSKNIFVSISAGNSGSDNYVGWPSCISNATSVGATTKSDTVASFSDIGPLMDILAPGESICAALANNTGSASCLDSYHRYMDGTSMATPHIAGAAALIQQYFTQLNNLNITPVEVKSVMRASGELISTSRSLTPLPRIDVLAATSFLLLINSSDNSTSNSNGKIKFNSSTDLSSAASCIRIHPNLISVNSADCPQFNKSAEILLVNLSFAKTPRILRDNETCPPAVCTAVSYSGNNLTLTVSGFTNYSSGINANLTIWDDTDNGFLIGENQQVYFYANYTNSSNGVAVSTGSCTINNSGVINEMLFNSTTQLFQFNRSYSSASIYSWEVNCSHADFEPLNSSDTVSISSPSCGMTINASTVLSQDLTVCAGGAIIINNDSVVLDCAGHILSGLYVSTGVSVNNRSNVTITNCTLSYFENGISINNSNGISINNISGGQNNVSAVKIYNSSGIIISNSTFSFNNQTAIFINNSGGNLILNNTFLSNTREGIRAINSSNDVYFGNTFNNTGWNVSVLESSSRLTIFAVGSNITFRRNAIHNNKVIGGIFLNGSPSIFEGNSINSLGNFTDAYGTAYGVGAYSSNLIFANNTLYLIDSCNVQFAGSQNVTIEMNNIFSTSSGVCISYVNNSVIRDNNLSNAAAFFSFSYSRNAEIYNNRFVKETLGSIRLSTASYNFSIFNNTFINYSDISPAQGAGCGINGYGINLSLISGNNFTASGTVGTAVCVSTPTTDNVSMVISGNTITGGNAAFYGSWFDYGINITENNVTGTSYGFYFSSFSKFIKVSGNILRNIAYYVFYDQISSEIYYINNFITNSTYGYYSVNDNAMIFANNTVTNSYLGTAVDNLNAENNTMFNNTLFAFDLTETAIVKNNNITANGNGAYGGIYVEGASYLLIANNSIRSNNGSGIYFNNSLAATLSDGNVSGNVIYGNELNGIVIERMVVSSLIIANNSISNNKESGIYSNSTTFAGGNISLNVIDNNSGFGMMFIGDFSSSVVSNNTISSNAESGIFVRALGSSDVIKLNLITGNGLLGSSGIELINLTGVNITGNNITNNTADGIFLLSSSAIIRNNNISNNNRSGIYSVDSSLNAVSELTSSNIFSGNNEDKFEIIWFVQAKTYNDTILVNGATLNISANGNLTSFAGLTTNASGLTQVHNVTQYALLNSGMLINYTPHNFTANYSSMTASSAVLINRSRLESRHNAVMLNFMEPPSGGTVTIGPSEAYETNDLTASASGFLGASYYAYNFFRNGNSLAVFNTPFDFFVTDITSKSATIFNDNTVYNSTGGKVGGAYYFSGTASSRVLVVNDYTNLTSGTIELWINPLNLPVIFGNLVTKTGNYRVAIRAYNSTNSNISFIYTNSTGGGVQVHTDAVITKNNWSHIAVTFSNSSNSASIYLNGAMIETFTLGGVSYGLTNLTIGNTFNGTIDELQIYPYVLSSYQIAAHYNLQYDKILSAETSAGDSWYASALPISASGLAGTQALSNTLDILSTSSGGTGGGGGGGGASGVFVAKPTVTEEQAAAKEAEQIAKSPVTVINTTPGQKPVVEQPAELEKPVTTAQIKKLNIVPWAIFLILMAVLVISYYYMKYRKKK